MQKQLDLLYVVNVLKLTLGCEDEIIDMVNGFIDRKKSSIEDTNNEREENLHVLDPFVQKWREETY